MCVATIWKNSIVSFRWCWKGWNVASTTVLFGHNRACIIGWCLLAKLDVKNCNHTFIPFTMMMVGCSLYMYVCVYVYRVSFIAFVNDGLVLFVVVTAIFLLLLLFCYNNNVDGNLFCLLFLKIMCILYPDRDQHKMLQAELFYFFFCLIFLLLFYVCISSAIPLLFIFSCLYILLFFCWYFSKILRFFLNFLMLLVLLNVLCIFSLLEYYFSLFDAATIFVTFC